jgi:hypothetical protein
LRIEDGLNSPAFPLPELQLFREGLCSCLKGEKLSVHRRENEIWWRISVFFNLGQLEEDFVVYFILSI